MYKLHNRLAQYVFNCAMIGLSEDQVSNTEYEMTNEKSGAEKNRNRVCVCVFSFPVLFVYTVC